MTVITRPFDQEKHQNKVLAEYIAVPPVTEIMVISKFSNNFLLKLAYCEQLYKGGNKPLPYEEFHYNGTTRHPSQPGAIMQLAHHGVLSVHEIEVGVYQYSLSEGMLSLISESL